jgi:hypothetical protein
MKNEKARRSQKEQPAKKSDDPKQKERLKDLDITAEDGGALKGGNRVPRYPDC